MDKLDHYRHCIKLILTDHAQLSASETTVKPLLIFDGDRDHYQLAYVGWRGDKRVFGPVMHFDLENGKIWLQYNGTEEAVAQRLVEMGVPACDIVLGFHSAFKRQFSGYAVE
ncbi:MAG: XisI protein [Chloroflexaceae bacterium]|nr:XisI protein [Chloroflexaceae bacterium]